MLNPSEKFYRRAAQIWLGIIAILIVFTFRQYGITWDEELQSQYGQAVVDYYTSLFKDQRYQEIFNLYLYGGMFDGLASVIDSLTPGDVYSTRHFVNAAFGLLGLWGIWRVGRYMGGGLVGLAALIMLTLTPMYYGHMFNNPKDTPFAAGIIWSIYYMARIYAERPRLQWKTVFKLGLIYGLTLGVRVGGAMLFFFWLVPFGIELLCALWKERRLGLHELAIFSLRRKWRDVQIIFPVGALAYCVMLICWPWAQQSPIVNPLRALSEFSNFPQNVEVLLDGTSYMSTELPWTYVPFYFGIQLPEYLLGLLGLSIILMPWIVRRLSMPQRQSLIVIVLMASVPVAYAVLRHPALYDAVRHFLFVTPLVCVLAAMALKDCCFWAVNEFHQTWARRSVAFGLCVAGFILVATQVFIMYRLHPYEYIYANRIVGGVRGIYGRYELDYWGSSFKEAAEDLQAFVAKEGGVPPGKIYKIAICGPWDSAMIYLPPDYEPVVANEPAEFFLATTRWMCQNMRPGKEIISVKRLGAPLSIIKDLRGGFEYYEGNEHKPGAK